MDNDKNALPNNHFNFDGSPLRVEARQLAKKEFPHLAEALEMIQLQELLTNPRDPKSSPNGQDVYDADSQASSTLKDAMLLGARENGRLNKDNTGTIGGVLPDAEKQSQHVEELPAHLATLGIKITPDISNELAKLHDYVAHPKQHDGVSDTAIEMEKAVQKAQDPAHKPAEKPLDGDAVPTQPAHATRKTPAAHRGQ
jgi:hypothetical protein